MADVIIEVMIKRASTAVGPFGNIDDRHRAITLFKNQLQRCFQ